MILAVILVSFAMLAASWPALANNGHSGSGGERPSRMVVSIQSLMRMSKTALRDLSHDSYRLKIQGVMGEYNTRRVIAAIIDRPVSTARLIDRLENATSDAARLKIATGLLETHARTHIKKRHLIERLYRSLRAEQRLVNPPGNLVRGQKSSDPLVQQFYTMQDENAARGSLIRLLEDIVNRHSETPSYW
ncbi:hypothetical protein [Hoeflea alexandrii]|uniref:hypothetical protein n=1 Tax=Hoeflea alexandrii TaxID=288436 RepID=UPI0022AEDA8D|nr:hypothetical protein [Hoeflea alexandrii]MCZ4287987.1 hypothetical protein [Hoeflea alexandrii]